MKMKSIVLCPMAVVGLLALWWLLPFDRKGSLPGPAMAAAGHLTAADLGYTSAFERALKTIGQISPAEFAQRYGGKLIYTPRLSWDPSTARFWDRFNLDPNQKDLRVRLRGAEERQHREWAKQQGKPIPDDEPIMVSAFGGYDFRLNAEELACFKRNGFVVSERMGAASCTDMFYRIYKRDLPVFVSADAVLHAWHRSYDALLMEIETEMLIPALEQILAGMSAKIDQVRREYADGFWADSVADADYFLTVARSLLAGKPVPSALGHNERVAQTLRACESLQLSEFELFGSPRVVDFSQFKPRGHYEKIEALRRYFKAMTWCGRIDFRVAGELSPPRQLAAAIVLHDLLHKAGQFEHWQQFDRMIQTFVGQADSMTFAQLGALLQAAGIRSPKDVKDAAALLAVQARIAGNQFGVQEIRGAVFFIDPASPDKFMLPRSFAFLGQRFTVDSWVTAKVVYDDIRWDGEAVMRRIPSCLDVGFAVFANDHTVPALVGRMTNPAGRPFRDGLNYQHNLAALRQVLDAKPDAVWQQNLYTGWLGCLRELSQSTTDAKYPEAMRTQAWAMKTLNTQLASWTQLRHDTILYVKQSYTAVPSCYYPAGYVEPVPQFWARMEQMAQRAATLIERTSYPQPAIQQRHAAFLRNFADKLKMFTRIAEKELAQNALNAEETKFLEDVVETYHERFGSGAVRRYAGWYPSLFYLGSEDSLKWDALVADVHTNPPALVVGDPGCVLHEGVGNVDLLLIAVDSGRDRMIFAGPVLSHFEFEMPGVIRKTDSEWQKDLQSGRCVPRPEWTRDYLVTGDNKEAKNYRAD